MLRAIRKTRIHEEVFSQIHELIKEGRFKGRDQLPSERELAETFKVSRTSVREATIALELQGVVEVLWTDATIAAHLQTAAACYTARRTALRAALAQHGIAASGRSGLNVWIPVPEEGSVVTSMAAAGWAIRAGERHRLHSPPAVRVTISTLQPPEATQFAADLARSLRPTRRTSSA